MQYTCTTCNIQSFEDQEPTYLHVHSSHEYNSRYHSTYLWFPLYKSGCCTETFIVFKELAGYITRYSEVDYFLSGFKEASGL